MVLAIHSSISLNCIKQHIVKEYENLNLKMESEISLICHSQNHEVSAFFFNILMNNFAS